MTRPQAQNPNKRFTPTKQMILAAVSIAAMMGTQWEGERFYAYDDFRPKYELKIGDKVKGTLTVCKGHTGPTYDGQPIIIGHKYTKEFCDAQYEVDIVPARDAVLRCTPELFVNKYTAGSIIDFAYNAGGANYCGSTMARKFKAGDVEGACAELVKWSYSKKTWLQGLFFRRQDETEKCLMGVA